jgi:hypothetical protein
MYSTVNDLVVALLHGEENAHRQFEELLSRPISVIIEQVAKDDPCHPDRDLLYQRAIALAKMDVRSCEETNFHRMSFAVFRDLVLYKVSRILLERSGPSQTNETVAEVIPISPHYQVDSLFRPSGDVGGDWLGGDLLDDGTVWILVADVSGKGYAASIVARGLPLLWRIRPVNDLRKRKCEPVELLDLLGRELSRYLPIGVFVEATAARLDPSGQVSVGGAGDIQVISRQYEARSIALHRFGGPYLGFDIPAARSQRSWQLDPGDELLLATDGFFDQPTHNGLLVENLPALHARHHKSSLLSTFQSVLGRVWAEHPQFDDTTLVGVSFKRAL